MRRFLWLVAVWLAVTAILAAPVAAESDTFADYAAAYVRAVGYAHQYSWFAKDRTQSELYQASLNAMAEYLGVPAPKLSGDPEKDRETAVAFLRDALARLKQERDRDELFRVALEGILKQWDHWTSALTPLEKLFTYASNGYFDEGDGLILRSVPEGEVYVVEEVLPDTPGARAGIKVGDVITAISGIPSRALLTADDALIYRIEREARQKGKIVYSIKRGETIVNVEIEYSRRKEPVVKARLLEGQVGYIWFPGFIAGVGYEFEEAITSLAAKGMSALVIDLRGNEGGSTWELQLILSHFLGGQLFGLRSRSGTRIIASVVERPLDIPVVVVLDKNSASASEVVAFALKDRPKTRIFGVNIVLTYGKGVGQSSWLLSNGWRYAFTTVEVVSPTGETYHGRGVRVHESITADDVEKGKEPSSADPAIVRALQWLKGQT